MIKAEINDSKSHLEMSGAADELLAEMGCFVKAVLKSVLESVPEEIRNDIATATNHMMLDVMADARKEAEVSSE